MQPWLRLTLITMTVGGGFAGVVVTLQALFHSPGATTFQLLLMLIFAGLYAFVTVSGLLFVQNPGRTRPLVAALGLQIPWISSSFIVYKFVAGVEAFIIVGSRENESTTGGHLGWTLLLGCSWKFEVLRDHPLQVGVNFAALAVLVLLLRMLRLRPSSSVAPPIG